MAPSEAHSAEAAMPQVTPPNKTNPLLEEDELATEQNGFFVWDEKLTLNSISIVDVKCSRVWCVTESTQHEDFLETEFIRHNGEERTAEYHNSGTR